MISFQHVSKRYIKHKALRDVTFNLEKGKVIGVVGENGSGKSTTLKLIAGLLRPTSGEVTVDDQKVDRGISRMVAYMSELDHVYPFFTVGEAVDYFASQFNDLDREKAEEILSFMKLRKDQKVKTLSKGNKGRLKMTITLARKVPYILLDEPFSGLDPMVRNAIVKGLIRFVDLDAQSLIITTHEIREIEPVLDEVLVIREGQVLGHELVDDIRSNGRDIVGWMEHLYEGGHIDG
ncbi:MULTISPECIES: ABC transporter ATP-binding protein [Pontibacillus]|uniref:ABC transporter ATP-binding protein n=1 Tax=Pontibacillus chungwhensis TaxID=265426 RepID=A0ABY8UVD8_9BACI|nr:MULTISPECIES: ABC transporter ATP-binding protein [Pontibacillus]MCD5325038.1 ABC transporter ATP-binding protein [Pontibacillus sp. HN14]WIF97295.1 ABC transporter ATP-binding protein [Pontibacillus chungwhensis]